MTESPVNKYKPVVRVLSAKVFTIHKARKACYFYEYSPEGCSTYIPGCSQPRRT